MGRYAVRRLLSGLLLLFAMSITSFALFRLIPLPTGCILVGCGPGTTTTDEQLQAAEHELGTDRPVPVQYAKFVWRIVRHGSFGSSWVHGSIDAAIRQAAPRTISVLLGGAVLLLLLAIPLGVLSAVHAQERIDRIILTVSVVGIALHPFIVGLFLTKFFSDYTHVTPHEGYCHPFSAPPGPPPDPRFPPGTPGYIAPPCAGLGQWAYHMILPWLTFALFFLPLYTRMIRARALETLEAQHVTAARAKGASELRVLRSHVLRPALLPLATMIGLDLGGALMVAIYIETIYRLGGFGSLMLSVVAGGGVSQGYDLPLIAALFFVIAAFAILLNLVVDLLYGWFDPRVRLA
jgi:peptide/nickel transport system permease protein